MKKLFQKWLEIDKLKKIEVDRFSQTEKGINNLDEKMNLFLEKIDDLNKTIIQKETILKDDKNIKTLEEMKNKIHEMSKKINEIEKIKKDNESLKKDISIIKNIIKG